MASSTDAKIMRHIHTNMVGLRNIGPSSNAQYKFEIENSSFDKMDEDDPMPAGDWVINGKIFPKNSIYGGRPLRIQISIPPTYPVVAPTLRLLQRVFHQNVMKDGQVCVTSLNSVGGYKPATSLVDVVAEVAKLMDEPSIDLVQHTEAAALRASDPAAYETKAREVFATNQSY